MFDVAKRQDKRSAGRGRERDPAQTGKARREPGIAVQRATAVPDSDDRERSADRAATALVGAAAGSATPFGTIVEDGAEIASGQVARADFFVAMAAAVEQVAAEELARAGRTIRDCPYLEAWLSFYSRQSAAHLERAIRRYANPVRTDSAGLQEAVVGRVRAGVAEWARSGRLTAVPAGIDLLPGSDAIEDTRQERGPADVQRAGARGAPAVADVPGPAAVRAGLGPGRPLETGVRHRMERGFGTSFEDVQIHSDPGAAAATGSLSARAFTVGSDIAFGRGEYRPGTLGGDLLLAHELAHVVQQREPAGANGSGSLELGATDAAAAALASSVGLAHRKTPSLAAGLRLQRCGGIPDPAPRDWREQDRDTYDTAVSEIRRLHERERQLLAQPGFDDARSAELTTVQQQLRAQVEVLQGIGIRRDFGDIVTRVIAGEDLRRITASMVMGQPMITGAEPTRIRWGERRRFTVVLPYVPPAVDIQIGWRFYAGGQRDGVQQQRFTHETSITLDEEFWGYFEQAGRQDLATSGRTADPGFSIIAEVYVGGGDQPETAALTDWLHLEEGLPTTLAIASPRIISISPTVPAPPPPTQTGGSGPQTGTTSSTGAQQTQQTQQATPTTQARGGSDPDLPQRITIPAPVQGQADTTAAPASPTSAAGQTPAAVGTATAAPPVIDYVLEDAYIEFQLSWIPPMRAAGQGPSYAVWWSIVDETVSPPQRRWWWDPHVWRSTYRFPHTGRFTVNADVYPEGQRSPTTPPPLLSASRSVEVISSDQLASIAMGRAQQIPPQEASAYLGELDSQIATAQRTLAAGSVEPDALRQHIAQLTEMRANLRRNLGGGDLLPFPAQDSGFDQTRTYATSFPAVFARPDVGGAVPLTVFMRMSYEGSSWTARIIDTTTQDVTSWDGSGQSPWDAARAAFGAWQSGNDYPQGGTVQYSFDRYGWNLSGHFGTSSTRKTFWEWFDRILFWASAIVAIALLLIPEPTGLTKAAGIALLSIGILRSTYAIYRNLDLGRPLLDTRNVLEALSIVAGFLGLRGGSLLSRAGVTAAREGALVGPALTQFRVGTGMIMGAVGVDVGTFVYATDAAITQLQAAQNDPSIPAAQREAQMHQVLLQLVGQGLLIIGSNASLFRRPRAGGGFEQGFVERIAAHTGGEIHLDPSSRVRIEAELRQLGVTEEMSALSDTALLGRYLDIRQAQARTAPGGAVLGTGVYELDPAGPLTMNRVLNAVQRGSAAWRSRLGGQATFSTTRAAPATATTPAVAGGSELVITIPPAAPGGPSTSVTVAINFDVVPSVSALAAPASHGAEAGPARLSISRGAGGQWVAQIILDKGIGANPDIQNLVGHELDEAARIVQRVERDPTTSIDTEQEARVFRAGGTAGPLSAHDAASAHELRGLFEQLTPALSAYDAASTAAGRGGGAPIPALVKTNFEVAERRLGALLDAMGFADPTTRGPKLQALLTELGLPADTPLARYIDYYARMREARTLLQAYTAGPQFGGPAGGQSVLSPELVSHLAHAGAERGTLATGTAGNFVSSGVPGGHVEGSLYAFEAAHPEYAFVVWRTKGAAGTDFKLHLQYEQLPATAGAAPPGRPPRTLAPAPAAGAAFPRSGTAPPFPGWHASNAAKSTAGSLDVMLGQIEQGFVAWQSSPTGAAALPPTGTRFVIGDLGGRPSMVSSQGVKFGGVVVREPGGGFRLTSAWVDLSWF
jgi:hypothetical protein